METRFIGDIRRGHSNLLVATASAPSPGPVIWVTAGAHGNEVTGVQVALDLINEMRRGLLCRGQVNIIPVMNQGGFGLAVRNVPIDGMNLNNNYPGNASGSYTERLADQIHAAITASEADLVIDLHTTATRSLPHVILDRYTTLKDSGKLDRKIHEVAQAFGIPLVHDYTLEEYLCQGLDRCLPSHLINHHSVAAFTVELGPTGFVSAEHARVGLSGLLNILRHLSMVQELDAGTPPMPSPVIDFCIRREPELRASSTGIAYSHVVAGDLVSAGTRLITISDPAGHVAEAMEAPFEGYVLSIADRGAVYPGCPLITIATPEHQE